MDARELTVVVNKLRDQVNEIEKQVTYLTREAEMIRLLVSDLQIDVKMLNGGKI